MELIEDIPPFDPQEIYDPPNVSSGVQQKPDLCKRCPYQTTGIGFCSDFEPDDISKVKFAVFLEAPGKDEIIERTPLVGRAGQLFFKQLLPKELSRNNIIIGNTLRCHPPNNIYPTGKLRLGAEKNCRSYDDLLKNYNPDVFILTYHPSAVMKQPAYLRLVREDLKKALKFSKIGYKPCVLMGEKAITLHFPVPFKPGKGGLRAWRGHYIFKKWDI